MHQITITTQNAAEVILQEPVLSRRLDLQSIVREAKTLEATHSPPFLWRNLAKKAYDLLTKELIAEVERDGIKIIKKKQGEALRVMNCMAFIHDSGSMEKCIAAGATKYPYLTIFRKGDRVDMTWYQ